MAIIGIERIHYCVDDVVLCTRFFDDFGLLLADADEDRATFLLPNNSKVAITALARSPIPGSHMVGPGVHEVIWGVDTQEAYDRLVVELMLSREVRRDERGIAHFVCDDGIAMGLRVWSDRREVVTSTDPVNSPGRIQRLITHCKCIFARADGTNDHHNIDYLNAKAPFPGADGQLRFHHTNFGVTDIDEIMVGKNYMERRGWPPSGYGLGRHRIASSLFLYLPAPTGGEAEHGADSDALDDSWVPRSWEPMFGFASWVHDIPPFFTQGADWDVGFVEAPSKGSVKPR